MCEWGTSCNLTVTIPAHLSHTGKPYQKHIGIDACIAPIVNALNNAGIETASSCCGHSECNGTIVLADGSAIEVQDYETTG